MIRNHSKVREHATPSKEHMRGRSHSNKGAPLSQRKKTGNVNVSSKAQEKVLTQTTSSKMRRSQQLSPGKSRSGGRKGPVSHHLLSDKISTKSMRKGRLGKQKTFMMQSLNIPPAEPVSLGQEFMRNNSQQLTTNNMEQSLVVPQSLLDVLVRTQKVFEQYESTCSSLRKRQRENERELREAKGQITSLQKKLAMRRSREL